MEASHGTDIEPIAVIGFAVKFPQQASNSTAFWDLLIRGGSARTEVPADRYNAEAFYRVGGNAVKTGTNKTKHGHFIAESLDRFDARFFSIAPHEAECIDPQQRWLLESTYHALENAGLPLDHVNGSNMSVYVGCFMNDHETMVHKDLEMPNTYHATGNASAMLANRISWFYNLSGPSMSVNTACSGSLVALHLACQSLRSRESRMALVCGSNLLFTPESTNGLSNLNFLSPDGKCYSFDERANGYARGEGIVSLVIKPLSTAIQGGDTIRALIRGTGVNSDGRTPGITQPSSEAQIALMRKTYSSFGLDPSLTQYFEAHGTGTAMGDPLEAKAIATVFSPDQRGNRPLYVGAVKSNIGHLEGASGLASVVKSILALEKAVIPPNIWLDRVNPAIQKEWGLTFPTKEVPFPGEGVRRASVNSFGFGGTNAHVVLDDAESYLKANALSANSNSLAMNSSSDNSRHQASKLLIWSAADESGVVRLHDTYTSYFHNRAYDEGEEEGARQLESLAYTLSQRRTHHTWRSFSICEAPKNLRNLNISAATKANSNLQVCYVFTGQGAQWAAMGHELLSYDVFRQSLENSDAVLRDIGCQFSILAKLYSDTGKTAELDLPEFCQPICTALQIALVELLAQWNIKPVAVLGHSSGEIAAAFCAGLISRTQALEVAFFKGVAVAAASQMNSRCGGMMAMRLSPEKCEAVLSKFALPKGSKQDALQIACYNSPQNITMSGAKSEIDRLQPLLEADGIMVKKLNVGIAYHNVEHLHTAAVLFRALIEESSFKNMGNNKTSKPQCAFISSVHGRAYEEFDASEISTPDHWVNNLVCPVQFTKAVQSLASLLNKDSMSDTHFLEIGPHSTLKSALKEILPKTWKVEQSYSSILARQQPAMLTALTMAGRLHCLGYPINIASVNSQHLIPKQHKILTDLPPYPFDHSKGYWLESRTSKNHRFRGLPHHDFLGTPTPDWNVLEAQWNSRIILQEKPFVKDHKVAGAVVYPAAGILVMAIEGAQQLGNSDRQPKGYRFTDVFFSKMIVIPETNQGVETQFRLHKNDELCNQLTTVYDFRLYMYDQGEWTRCSRGSLAVEYQEADSEFHQRVSEEHRKTKQLCKSAVVHDDFYSHLRDAGLDYGPLFRIVDEISYGEENQGIGDIDTQRAQSLTGGRPQSPCLIHPATLDCIFQIAFLGITQGGQIDIPTLVPTEIKELWISGGASKGPHNDSVVQVAAQSFRSSPRTHTTNYTSFWRNDAGPFLAGDITLTSIGSAKALEKKSEDPVSLYHIEWKPDVNLFSSSSKPLAFILDQAEPELLNKEQISLTEYACFLAMSEVLSVVDSASLPSAEQPVHLQKYLNWMRHQTALMQDCESWRNFVSTQPKTPESREQLLQKVGSFGPEGKVISRLSRVLLQIVQSEVDALPILFADETLAEYYRLENPPPKVARSVRKYVDCLAHGNPQLKVLEIGGGTGGVTRGVLDSLRERFSEYRFTDISPAFFKSATEKFGREGFTCKTLNIEIGPGEQGFDLESYDLVIASNVLHATRCLSTTLNNTRKLLKPGGKLILVEGISPNLMRTSYIFGCLSGWWLSTESFRKWSPLVPAERWDQLLKDNQFTGTDLVYDGSSKETALSSLMISTACNNKPTNGITYPESDLVIVRLKASALQHSLALSIQTIGGEMGLQVSITDVASFQGNPKATYIFLQTMDQFSFQNPQEDQYGALKKVLRNVKNILWVTRRSESNVEMLEQDGIIGLSRSIASETEGLKMVTLRLEEVEDTQRATQNIWSVLRHYFELTSNPSTQIDGEEIAEIDGNLCISRLIPAKALQNDVLTTRSKDEQLGVEPESPYNGIIGDEDIELELEAIGYPLHREYSGTITQIGKHAKDLQVGTRAIAVIPNSMATLNARVKCPAELVHQIPHEMKFEEAVAMPIDFMIAYDALMNWARLRKGESVLIHDGAGELGQAAIQIALLEGADLFVTCAKAEDAKLVSDLYQVPISHALVYTSSGNCSADIKQLTRGRGFDIVFNPLASKGLRTLWGSVASRGRVVEVGSPDKTSTGSSSLYYSQSIKKNIMFASIDLSEILQDRERVVALFSTVMGIIKSKKIVAARPLRVYSRSEVEDVSRNKKNNSMSSGKIVLTFAQNHANFMLTTPRTSSFDANATYLITGGLGGLGKSIAKWMVVHGARHLLLLSRSGANSSGATSFLDRLRASGVTVLTPKCDIGDEDAVRKVFQEVEKRLPPIKGCIQASMVLKSAMFQNLSLEQWTDTVRSKVQGSINLHKHVPASLDFLIFLSSICGIIGASGQSNYAFGCAYQDALARFKVATGQKTISIDLGIVDGVGYTAEHRGVRSFMHSLGLQALQEDYIHALLEYYCDPSRKIQESKDAQVVTGIMTQQEMRRKGIVQPRFYSRPLMRHLVERKKHTVVVNDVKSKAHLVKSVALVLDASSPSAPQVALSQASVSKAICGRLSEILDIPIEDIDAAKPLHTFGVDSLVSMEIRGWFKESMQADVAVFDILSNLSINLLAKKVVDK